MAGLSAAYDLGRQGYDVLILESSNELGGLASSLKIEGKPVERFYHFICRSDSDLIQMVDELGLSQKLHWERSRTEFFYNGQLYKFGFPFDLLRFTAQVTSRVVGVQDTSFCISCRGAQDATTTYGIGVKAVASEQSFSHSQTMLNSGDDWYLAVGLIEGDSEQRLPVEDDGQALENRLVEFRSEVLAP